MDVVSLKTGYQLEAAVRSDPHHEGYWQDDLYPTDDDWRVINDLAVIEVINKSGDNGAEPRQIDHWVYFGNQTGMLPFLTWAGSEGFTHDDANSTSTDDGRYSIVRAEMEFREDPVESSARRIFIWMAIGAFVPISWAFSRSMHTVPRGICFGTSYTLRALGWHFSLRLH